jgi:hypothetical protein
MRRQAARNLLMVVLEDRIKIVCAWRAIVLFVLAVGVLLPGPSRAETAGVSIDQFLADIQKVLIKVRDASDINELRHSRPSTSRFAPH